MSLINCKECKAEISDAAKTCPKCGAPVPKPTSQFTLLVAGLLAIGALSSIFGRNFTAPSAPTATAAAPPSPEILRAEQDRRRSEELAVQRQRMARAATAAIRATVRDPDSLVIEEVGVSLDGKVACATYRARNGFGGMNRERMAFIDGIGTQDAGKIARHCQALLAAIP